MASENYDELGTKFDSPPRSSGENNRFAVFYSGQMVRSASGYSIKSGDTRDLLEWDVDSGEFTFMTEDGPSSPKRDFLAYDGEEYFYVTGGGPALYDGRDIRVQMSEVCEEDTPAIIPGLGDVDSGDEASQAVAEIHESLERISDEVLRFDYSEGLPPVCIRD